MEAGDASKTLRNVVNFRDVGAVANHLEKRRRFQTGRLYRSGRLDEASLDDQRKLAGDLKIASVIDLRTKTERLEQADKKGAKVNRSAAVPEPNDDAAKPLKIPSISYHEINLNGWDYSRMIVAQLSWWELFKLIFLMLIGRRLDAIKVLAPYMERMGLLGLARATLEYSKKELKQVFEVLADDREWPLVVHCTQGKDRTGLIIMLILFLCDTPLATIENDYMTSNKELEAVRAEKLEEIASIGLSEQFADAHPDMVAHVYSLVQEKYGGIEEYLASAGVGRDMQRRVQKNCMSPEALQE
ncbi:hypothetical protein M011DRAFT_398523 [Sporormia fimetaria CBS 119925]|uniref:Tyrosine specific protein phosphatases domain-containing protein n=1 Tax=Sporormia fimetaria CBS 119925 TaxID=1340428 RepID=A0A6A6VJL9_9PLEO|nr:hypothetical protein M011DRAFT_398523 [Sporormia fimetaria CBS 119925]